MKVTILEPSGYCKGVDRAINIAKKAKKDFPSKNVVILGMLVHNDDALKALEDLGIKTIYKKDSSLEELINLIDKNSIVILTAHGHDEKIEKTLKDNGHTIIDATCPFVKQSFDEIKKELKKGNDIIYIGVKNHPESNAALSISKSVAFVDVSDNKIPLVGSYNPLVISQTTLSNEQIEKFLKEIKINYPDAKIKKGICNASTLRQESIKNIKNDVDCILIVGGINSNNSKTLYLLAKTLYPNKRIEMIQNSSDLKEKDLKGLNHIAISSGASTPKEMIFEIRNTLLN